MATVTTDSALDYVINHVFLPAKLPQESDANKTFERHLCRCVRDSMKQFRKLVPEEQRKIWALQHRMLENLAQTQEHATLDHESVEQSLLRMKTGGALREYLRPTLSLLKCRTDSLIYHIRSQNAGVIFRKPTGRKGDLVYESFELSPATQWVMETQGKLIRSFPGPAICVPPDIANDPLFCREVGRFLAQMDKDTLDSGPTTRKAGVYVTEERDSSDPHYITSLLTGILRGHGHLGESYTIEKRTADDVLFMDAKLPWRRSPMWLLIRVALQTSLFRLTRDDSVYKYFMLYFMCCVLKHTVDRARSSDLLSFMSAKIARRLHKLGDREPEWLGKEAEEAVGYAQSLIDQRWKRVQDAQSHCLNWEAAGLDFPADTCLSLIHSKPYILSVGPDYSADTASEVFRPSHPLRHRALDEFSFPPPGNDFEKGLFFADFELAVEQELNSWLESRILAQTICMTLAQWISDYSTSASAYYGSNGEDQSVMFLTVLDLWAALDNAATKQCHILKMYSPDIPPNILEALLVRTAPQVARLRRINRYLQGRSAYASYLGRSVFVDSDTFAVQYFDACPELQSLKTRIEADAEWTKQEKIKELLKKDEVHRTLVEKAAELDHEYVVNRRGQMVHSWYCEKCKWEDEAQHLTISVHEWPLPSDTIEAKAAVFELQCPEFFQAWRNATWQILNDFCIQSHDGHDDPPILLENYSGLEAYMQQSNRGSRVTYASETKSFERSHYNNINFPCTESDVCLPNGLKLQLFDSKRQRWASTAVSSLSQATIMPHCGLSLPPDEPYIGLQNMVSYTDHTSNNVMASQSNCPPTLSLHEYITFGHLRAGGSLQWMNIARVFAARSLTFRTESVHALLMQAAWQIGPLIAGGTPLWHVELENGRFGLTLLKEMSDFLRSVETNWLEVVSLRSVILLVTRLLVSTRNPTVKARAYNLMCFARHICCRWMDDLRDKLANADEDDLISDYQLRLCETAATCKETFDVCPQDLDELFKSPRDLDVLLTCIISVHDYKPSSSTSLSDGLQRLLARDRRLNHFLFVEVMSRIHGDPTGLDAALRQLWAGYRPGSKWLQLSKPNDRWIFCRTREENAHESQTVHFNVLEGTLLIDGKPLGQLPQSILDHPTYRRLFLKKILDIVPSDMPGMQYVTRTLFNEHLIYFSAKDSGQDAAGMSLIIRTKQANTIHELIPREVFSGDLPQCLVDNFVHWLCISNLPDRREIEFRPLETPWNPSSPEWCLNIQPGISGISRMRKNSSFVFLIDVLSPTFEMIETHLSPLEKPQHILATYLPSDERVDIDLPRYRLSFFLNTKLDIESKNMTSMIVDTNQSSGTMFGLVNQLVLRSKNPTMANLSRSRRVLIPYSTNIGITKSESDNHVEIRVRVEDAMKIRYESYFIDTDLGCLTGNGSMMSRLYKIYLHALTSSSVPDPLTGRSGTEEALCELTSASVLSFQRLEAEEMKLLQMISAITPRREFYPAHKKVMQRVHWHIGPNLAPNARHYEFYKSVRRIMNFAEEVSIFQPDTQVEDLRRIISEIRVPHEELILRAHLRGWAMYRTCYSPMRNEPVLEDVDLTCRYPPRDLWADEVDEDEAGVYRISSLVRKWPTSSPNASQDLFGVMQKWGALQGSDNAIPTYYDKFWLKSDMSSVLLSLYGWSREGCKTDIYFPLLFILSALSYRSPEGEDFAPTILAFATVNEFCTLDSQPPPASLFDLSVGFHPPRDSVLRLATREPKDFKDTPSYDLEEQPGTSINDFYNYCSLDYKHRLQSEGEDLADHFCRQWPCQQPAGPTQLFKYIQPASCLGDVERLFESTHNNRCLRRHIERVQDVLDRNRGISISTTSLNDEQPLHSPPIPSHLPRSPFYQFPSVGKLLHARSSYLLLPQKVDLLPSPKSLRRKGRVVTTKLRSLLRELQAHRGASQRLCALYGRELNESRLALQKERHVRSPDYIEMTGKLKQQLQVCRGVLQSIVDEIRTILSPRTLSERVIALAGQWPCLSMKSLLAQLSSSTATGSHLPDQWRKNLMTLTHAVLCVQWSQRLLSFASPDHREELYKELDNKQLLNVKDISRYPDWLLIQIEGNFLVRPLQCAVAHEMINPETGQNCALQLNMGEGKSSVIVPLVVSALADGEKLVRVVVLKPLAAQMFKILVDRLSGLANRRIFYLDFSRKIPVDTNVAQRLQRLFESCMKTGGILLAHPEHLLSFNLMGIDRLLELESTSNAADRSTVDVLLDTQKWLDRHSRDVLDESDEILHTRYQLVYTSGTQQSLEYHPTRWTVIQRLLELVEGNALALASSCPDSLKLQQMDEGRFPFIRIMQSPAGEDLISRIVDDIQRGALENVNLALLPVSVQAAALRFITDIDVGEEDCQLVEKVCRGSDTWKTLLLLRGLLAHNIILYVLKERRWRVDYGLDLRRSLLAVPYRAKDVPAVRAEFGHPDVTIALTCLSYYYSGVTNEQLEMCFGLLFRLDNPGMEYEKWVRGIRTVPTSLRSVSGVNLKDMRQWKEAIYPLFHKNKSVVNFFLCQVVFPREAKEYPHKLATSGWDLAKKREHPTTGFSGTNDNRYLLPTSMSQVDPVNQSSTNAKVLCYLLQPENDTYICARDEDGSPLSVVDFLRLLGKRTPRVRVLLDVGAQMLDLQNEELCRSWLRLREDTAAAVFFNVRDELVVLTQDGVVESFISSPYSQQLEKCLVYLDDAHTRGTDLKLPRDSVAAVTLGQKITKDRLLQGCMRMRKLGNGQSLAFFGPPEVDRSIRKEAGKKDDDKLEVIDILRWAMIATCAEISQNFHHWAKQGYDFQKREEAWLAFMSCGSESTTEAVGAVMSSWLQPDSQPLEQMYLRTRASSEKDAAFGVPGIRDRGLRLGISVLLDTRTDEEQEREVSHEVEREQQIERPEKAKPAVHNIHKDVQTLIRTGKIPAFSHAFVPLFQHLTHTACDRPAWSKSLLATKDFCTTTKNSQSSDYLRPVEWVLSVGQTIIVMSPYEVNKLLPIIRGSKAVHLHIYEPRVAEAMRSFDDLRFYCVPALPKSWKTPSTDSIVSQLNLWAGQLYLRDYETYKNLCLFLGFYTEDDTKVNVQPDGFILPKDRREAIKMVCRFEHSPNVYLTELMGVRRKGMSYMSTDMGKILHGRIILEEVFEGRNSLKSI